MTLHQRIGQGIDFHRLEEGRELWLGGVHINSPKGCVAHSDGDVLIHAICDALLGHGGIYAPFLDLARVSEGEDGKAIAEQAGMLGLSAEQFNSAQMQALAFAATMEL